MAAIHPEKVRDWLSRAKRVDAEHKWPLLDEGFRFLFHASGLVTADQVEIRPTRRGEPWATLPVVCRGMAPRHQVPEGWDDRDTMYYLEAVSLYATLAVCHTVVLRMETQKFHALMKRYRRGSFSHSEVEASASRPADLNAFLHRPGYLAHRNGNQVRAAQEPL